MRRLSPGRVRPAGRLPVPRRQPAERGLRPARWRAVSPGPETLRPARYTCPAMPDRLILFDIDCTLIDARGAGGRAILRAIKDVYGVEGELGDYSFHGRTDPGIIGDLAALWGAERAGRGGRRRRARRRLHRALRRAAARGDRARGGEDAARHPRAGHRARGRPSRPRRPAHRQRGGGGPSQARADGPAPALQGRRLRLRLGAAGRPAGRGRRPRRGARPAGATPARTSSSSATRRPTSSAARRSGSRRSASPPAGTPWTSSPGTSRTTSSPTSRTGARPTPPSSADAARSRSRGPTPKRRTASGARSIYGRRRPPAARPAAR